jgi:type I restriction enzyme, S subunit
MSRAWPLVALGEVATSVERPEVPSAGTVFRQIGVRLWGEGTYERESIDGSQTKYKTLSRVEVDDIIVNKIWARNGSVAVVPEALAGCFGSGEFPTFAPDKTKLYPRWFHWITKTKKFWDQCDDKSRGTSGKNRIRPERFLEITIPLPPLLEQRRIVARIEELAAKIQEARGLRRQAVEEVEALYRSIVFNDSNAVLTPMHDLVNLRGHDVQVKTDETYHFAGVYCFGRGVFRGQKKSGMDFAYKQLCRINTGNFIYPKLMAWEGALGVVPKECDGLYVSPEFPVFQVNEDRVLPETLDVYFRTPSIWPLLSGASTGTNVRRRRLNPKDFLAYKIPLPSIQTQRRLRQVMQETDSLKSIQAETSAEMDALLPSLLDKAFRGELV